MAVADVFDALTHDRPYKEAWPLDAAVHEIRRLEGTQFSPRIVEAFDTLDHASLVTHAAGRRRRLGAADLEVVRAAALDRADQLLRRSWRRRRLRPP